MAKGKKLALSILGIFVFIGTFIAFKERFSSEYADRDKIIVYLNGEDVINKNYVEPKNIALNDCAGYTVDYCEEKQTVIYLNTHNEILQRNIETKETKVINDKEINAILQNSDNSVYNIQYGPQQGQISFIFDEGIYIYDLNYGEINQIVESCLSTDWLNSYQWLNSNELYYLDRSIQKTKLIKKPIESFILSDDGKTIYGIRLVTNFNGISMEMRHKIVEINLLNGTVKDLTEETDKNISQLYIHDTYLFYVQQSKKGMEQKLYRINLNDDKSKCIYKTKNEIVGIIVKD